MGQFGMGQPVRRTEDQRFITGRGRYTDDIVLPRQTYGYILRSPHAHARIRRIDTASAANAPGVVGVITNSVKCTANPLGIKGAGEAGAIGAPPAVINALVDALSDHGIEHVDMPATPQRVWAAIQRARPARAAE